MRNTENILWGLVLIFLGIVIGGNALGLIHINIFFDGWWTLFIIVPCFIGLFKDQDKTGNIIGLALGIALLLGCQNIIDFSMIWRLAFPAILVIIGLSMIFKDTFNAKISAEIKRLNVNHNNENSYCATFAGQDVNFNGETFTGADLTAVFGGLKCDLRKAIIKEDVVINASSIFGGIELYVPQNVKIKIKSTPIFGGIENKAKTEATENSPVIYINGTTIFGGIEIKWQPPKE